MNLAYVISREILSYDGKDFNKKQELIYRVLEEAIVNGERMLLPTWMLQRGIGKTLILKALHEKYNGEFFSKYMQDHRIKNMRGSRVRPVIVDDLSMIEMERNGVDFCRPVGFCSDIEAGGLNTREYDAIIKILESET